MEMSKIDAIIDKYGGEQRALTTMLQDVQAEYYYLSKEALQRVSERMGLPLIQVYQVAKFYKAFSLEPRGRHLITVCLGTACHVRGGVRIVEQIGRSLGIAPGETTEDRQFTLETVNCLGCCALGPVMVVDGKYHGKMAASRVDRVLKRYMKEAAANG
ncbi:MAG: NAD(P)H-dependent oxidoreductase subunit E [Chloroflexota bacterium]|nr:NAD(P)H-dependent oxidoreductase subunit E [Chloroflexota bacterium]